MDVAQRRGVDLLIDEVEEDARHARALAHGAVADHLTRAVSTLATVARKLLAEIPVHNQGPRP